MPLLVVDTEWVRISFIAREIKMLRLTFLLVLLPALFGISENVSAQSQSQMDGLETISRPQLESATLKDLLDPSNAADDDDLDLDEDEIDEDELDALRAEEDSELETESGDLKPERLTDERIRENWPKHSIREIDLSLAEVGRVPEDRSELLDDYGRVGPVSESVKVFAWEAPNIRYQPLYFEDVALERYGQTLTDYRQGIRSAIIFGAQFTGWSLALLEQNPKSCDHPLGFCRPGTCVPQTTQRHFFGAFSLR